MAQERRGTQVLAPKRRKKIDSYSFSFLVFQRPTKGDFFLSSLSPPSFLPHTLPKNRWKKKKGRKEKPLRWLSRVRDWLEFVNFYSTFFILFFFLLHFPLVPLFWWLIKALQFFSREMACVRSAAGRGGDLLWRPPLPPVGRTKNVPLA